MTAARVSDVVVVGGGAAGCVAAARLAESRSRSVLMLEAGPDLRADTPAEIRDGWRITREFDWGYASEPDARGAVQNLWRNKLLGGTSWVTRFALRGSPADYDEWAARGNAGWGFDDVLPYFRRLEADADFGDQPFHGDHGPMPVRRYLDVEIRREIGAAGMRALEAAGFPIVEDHNRPGAVGAGRMPMTSRDGVPGHDRRRLSPGWRDAAEPDDPTRRACRRGRALEGNRAMGVRLVDGEVIEAGWVVLCAGVYGSPPILMRSGVGPADAPALARRSRSGSTCPASGRTLPTTRQSTIDCGYRGARSRRPRAPLHRHVPQRRHPERRARPT